LTKQQEAYESTRIEFERMSAELNRVLELLEKSEAEKEQLRHSSARPGDKNQPPQPQQQQQHPQQPQQATSPEKMHKLEADCKQLTTERDQLVLQLEKSQEMLMNFQKELNNTEQELQRLRGENQK
jgi:hypothetical protein